MTREQDFREVRRLLGDPREQRPTPDLIVSNMIAAEQHIMNRLNSTSKPWTYNTISVNSVIGQRDYNVAPIGAVSFGKALFVYRELTGGILPIPFTDFAAEFQDQRYQFWVAELSSSSVLSAEKIAFFRAGNVAKMRFYPPPVEVDTYKIVFASGALDWDQFEWTDEPVMPEFSRLRQLYAALATIAKSEWEGLSRQENAAYRGELRGDLTRELGMHEEEFRVFIRNPQHEPSISEVGYFWE